MPHESPEAESRYFSRAAIGILPLGSAGTVFACYEDSPPNPFCRQQLHLLQRGPPRALQKLSESAHPPRLLIADQATKGGATLKILQGQESVHRKIREGHYDLVVLQEDIPELIEHDVAPFLEQVRLFDREIRGAGGNTALFMAWPYERLNWVGLAVIAEAHLAIGKELNVPVAPVGLAFQQSLQARPGLAMLGKDREHETIHGTYLAANVIYATIFW